MPIKRCRERLATEMSWSVFLLFLHFSPFEANVEVFSIAHIFLSLLSRRADGWVPQRPALSELSSLTITRKRSVDVPH